MHLLVGTLRELVTLMIVYPTRLLTPLWYFNSKCVIQQICNDKGVRLNRDIECLPNADAVVTISLPLVVPVILF